MLKLEMKVIYLYNTVRKIKMIHSYYPESSQSRFIDPNLDWKIFVGIDRVHIFHL